MKIRNVMSLFNGASCGNIALNLAGIEFDKYYASEVDKHANQITLKNHPDTIMLGDVTKWRDWDIDWSTIDLLIGGSPCQGFSSSGKELAFNDPRSALFFEYLNILNHIKTVNPDVRFLLENVKMKKENLDVISKMLEVDPLPINSSLVSAQNRLRYYWANWDFEKPRDKNITISDVLDIENAEVGQMQPFPRDYKKRGLKRVERLECRTDNKSNAILARSDKNLLKIGDGYRKLTPEECELLQGLILGYTEGVSNTQRYRMIGNGWTIDVIVHIFQSLCVAYEMEQAS